jgi:hypothetical protein
LIAARRVSEGKCLPILGSFNRAERSKWIEGSTVSALADASDYRNETFPSQLGNVQGAVRCGLNLELRAGCDGLVQGACSAARRTPE